MEDDLGWKMTFDGRRPLVVEDLQMKTTFNGRLRGPLMEDDIQGKRTSDGRLPAMKDHI